MPKQILALGHMSMPQQILATKTDACLINLLNEVFPILI